MDELPSGIVAEITVTCPKCRCVIEFRRVVLSNIMSAQFAAVSAASSAYCPECKWQAGEHWFASVTANVIEERISLDPANYILNNGTVVHDYCKELMPPA